MPTIEPIVIKQYAKRYEILEAPQQTSFSLSLFLNTDPELLRVDGDRIIINDEVEYKISHWDGLGLVADKVWEQPRLF